ncbi:MAG: hypothetical protein K6A40_13485 [Solobacterium sp.]|nr:hypothetical protein [Solobacterium sp.]
MRWFANRNAWIYNIHNTSVGHDIHDTVSESLPGYGFLQNALQAQFLMLAADPHIACAPF